ncbi:MAG: ABC transporter substrate-binding protein [Polaromonas sp.]
MPMPDHLLSRRQWLQGTSLLTAGAATPGWAQPSSSPRSITVAQLVDFSPSQQDVSKDFLIGSRAAWQDINLRGGIRGRSVQHVAVETDGTPASLRLAIDRVQDNAACVVLSGSVGDQLASQVAALSRQGSLNIAHAAPWLQNSSLEVDDKTFPIFAARQEQIAHALKTLSVMGMKDLGAVYASSREHAAYHLELERIAATMKLQLQSFHAAGDLRALGQKMTAKTPAVLLFVGGTPELAQFSQGLEKQARQRYLVALADVNLQTMLQMGAARNTPVIATQPVPLVNASLPIVRSYRETLARLFDEPATPLSLAGFIAARYTYEVLHDVEGTLTRQSALASFQRRSSRDIGGFRVSFNAQRRSNTYVTQSMMTPEGRLIG